MLLNLYLPNYIFIYLLYFEQVHLGEDIYLDQDKWELIRRKNDSKFVKDLAEVFWGRATLKKRCLNESRVNKGNTTQDSFRRELAPSKYKLLKSI